VQYVGRGKEHIGVAIGVGGADVVIIELLLTEGHLAAVGERLHRTALGGHRVKGTIRGFYVDPLTQPFLCIFVRDDFRPHFSQYLIAPGVIELPMSVEERANGVRINLRYRLEKFGGALRQAAINQHEAVAGNDHHHVASIARQ
jgi:hypothetical protein